jgi:hypothetical protein
MSLKVCTHALQDGSDVVDDSSRLLSDVGLQDAHGINLGAREAVVLPTRAGARDEQEVARPLDV